jgi:DNA-binding MarR family transcriptional regulator
MANTNAPGQRLASNSALTMIVQARVIEARVEAQLKDIGLSLRRLGILGHLRATPGISFSALARRAGIKVQSLHPIMDALIEQGVVTTVGGVGQGRAAVIELTAKGSEVFDRAIEVLAEVDREVFVEGDWKDLGDALIRVADGFRRGKASDEPRGMGQSGKGQVSGKRQASGE